VDSLPLGTPWPPKSLRDIDAVIDSAPFGAISPAYDTNRVKSIVKQGHDRPRPLTAPETTRATRNRAINAEDRRAMEGWYFMQGAGRGFGKEAE
jgi:hypothetical protein